MKAAEKLPATSAGSVGVGRARAKEQSNSSVVGWWRKVKKSIGEGTAADGASHADCGTPGFASVGPVLPLSRDGPVLASLQSGDGRQFDLQ